MKADEPIPTAELVELTSRLALEGSIDPIAGLANDRVWIFRGALDPYVRRSPWRTRWRAITRRW